jgi:transcriptional regulator with XRE-family HTH domain
MTRRLKPDPMLGVVLCRLRHRRGLTQADVAYYSRVTISSLSRIECGVSDPAWSSVRAIVGALSVSLEELGVEMEQR